MSDVEKKPCVSCGALVTGPVQEFQYEGHKPDCELVNGWLADEINNQNYWKEAVDAVAKEVDQFSAQLKEREVMRGDILCQKCGTDLGYGWDAMRHERKLIGGYKAIICVECVNLWHEHVEGGAGNNAYERIRKLEQEIAITQNCFVTTGGDAVGVALNALQPLYNRREAVQRELYNVGKEWIADKLPTPQTTGTVSNP